MIDIMAYLYRRSDLIKDEGWSYDLFEWTTAPSNDILLLYEMLWEFQKHRLWTNFMMCKHTTGQDQ